ncbi:hypothetical protein E8E15_000873 [Penicillium rubens]|nr:hypothetical protein E8E15_000873 [Penicillium rubens]
MLPSNEATPAGPPPHIIRSLSNDVDGTATVTSFPSKHWNGSFYGSSGRRRSTFQQITNLTQAYKSYNFNASVGYALASSVRTDDLTWLLEHCKESSEDRVEYGLLTPRTRRGRESSAYLSYIVDFYHYLPDYSIFIHASPEQWHNDLFGPLTLDTLKNLRLESVAVNGYVKLRC